MVSKGQQKQTVEVGRGLFLIRYAAAEDAAHPPRITVSSASDAKIEFHLHPDHREPVLWQPGSCLIVEALAPAKFYVAVSPVQNYSAAATVKVEPLTQGTASTFETQPTRQSAVPTKARESSVNLSSLRILGHLAGRGDVRVERNEWLGGPATPSRLEGIAIEWPDKPSGLDIRYAIKTAKPLPESGRKIGVGSFAGTRGRSMPIVSLMLELGGPRAADFQLSAEAIFLGSPAKQYNGKRVLASGPTGREPLVGLRLGLTSPLAKASPPKASQPKASGRKSPRSSGGVRVFRSRAKAG